MLDMVLPGNQKLYNLRVPTTSIKNVVILDDDFIGDEKVASS